MYIHVNVFGSNAGTVVGNYPFDKLFFEINCWHMSFLGALGFIFKLFKSFDLSTTFQEIAKFTATEARAIVANHRWTPSNVAFSVWTA